MIEAKNCPHNNTEWYDITDMATGARGKNVKYCVNLSCKMACSRKIIEDGFPFYDPTGEIARSKIITR